MLPNKEKEAFPDSNWVEAFYSCTVFSTSKSLKKTSIKKNVSFRQKLILKEKVFYRTYFHFGG